MEASLGGKGGRQNSKHTGFEVMGFESQPHPLPWASCFTSVSPSVSSCKMGVMTVPAPLSCCIRSMHVKHQAPWPIAVIEEMVVADIINKKIIIREVGDE